MAIGIATGTLFALVTKTGLGQLWKDSLLGALGYLVGFIGCIFTPWPQNTITEPLPNGGFLSTTESHYQHPARVAIALALLLPLLHQLYRLRHRHGAS